MVLAKSGSQILFDDKHTAKSGIESIVILFRVEPREVQINSISCRLREIASNIGQRLAQGFNEPLHGSLRCLSTPLSA